ncbi:uncharacterized protein [Halyomorpha halys]|uniref:uncharacterized protein n=1 Tax=Halyomorpha halys TaxID=286706 RepID=UPI0006D5221C|nr:uncharacterized protein LOC106686858 [Halyomorpha halys]
MRKKSKSLSKKKSRNGHSKAKKSRTLAAEDVSLLPIKSSLPLVPMENQTPIKSSLELSSLSPSTSQNTSQNAIALLEPDELVKINIQVKSLLDKCFQNQSEIVVNRRVFEDIVSETLANYYSEEDKFKSVTEAKHLTDKCKMLQTEQIKLNRQRYALKKQVEDAKHIIKKMIDEKNLFNRGIMRKILPSGMKRQVRSVGLQVCLVGPMFITKPVITYSTSITSQYTDSILPPEESPRTARKCTVNKEFGIKKVNEPSTSKVIQSQSLSSRIEKKKENLSGIKSKVTIGRMSEESASNKTLPIKQNQIGSKSNIVTRRMSGESGNSKAPLKNENPSESKSNITNRRMSTRKTKVEEVEHKKPTSVKVKSIKELNEIKNVKEVGNLTKVDSKGFENGIPIIKQEKLELIVKEEVIDEEVYYDVVEISEDEEIIESDNKDDIKIKKEAGVQVNVNSSTDENSYPKSNEASSSQGAGPLIKIRSPEFINEQFIKSLNSSSTTEGDNISFCQLPKYPVSPKYPPDVPKPPAPILQVGKKSNVETQGIMLTWSFACKKPENIVEYQLYAYQERSGRNSSNDVWKKVGDIKALPLPMACYLSQFVEDETYHFIIRAVDSHKRLGDFSIPAGIKLQKLDPTLKTPAGSIFKIPPTLYKN